MTRRTFIHTASAVAAAASALLQARPARASRTAFDVAVVGAGVIGCCVARELARLDVSAVVCEAGLDIACASSRANSGIVHAGFDPLPGTLKAAYNVRGAELFPAWQADLGFAYFKNGALVLAFSDEEVVTLEELRNRGIRNGASETFLLDQASLRELEPNVSPEAIAALYAPGSGICDPYGLSYGAAENAAANGVEFAFDARVDNIVREEDHGRWRLVLHDGSTLTARAVVNAAGMHSDELNNLVSPIKLRIQPRRGEYLLYKNTVHPVNATVFQAPTRKGKGVLVSPVVFGNLIVGPTSEPQDGRDDVPTTAAGLAEVLEKGARTWPELPKADGVISTFAGLRASSAGGDFVLGEAQGAPGFFNAACIDSPGLASAPAIAQDVAAWVGRYLDAAENPTFDPIRTPPPLLTLMDEASRAALVRREPLYGHTMCACSHVSKGELLDALRRPLPVLSLDALKWRTGCFMGPCQGGRCMVRIAELVCHELGVGPDTLPKRGQGSELVAQAGEAGEVADAGDILFPPTFERPRAAYLIPGTRPAGVYAARTVLDMLHTPACLPGRQAVVWGDTDQALLCTQRLEQAGTDVTRIGGDEQVLEVEGEGRVCAVRVLDAEGLETTLPCDLFVVACDIEVAQDEEG